MASTPGSIGNSLDRQIRGRQPEEDEMNGVSRSCEIAQPGRKRTACQRRLESKTDSLFCQVTQPREHHAPGADCRAVSGLNADRPLAITKVTERHYSPWVKARQDQLETEVRRIWATPDTATA